MVLTRKRTAQKPIDGEAVINAETLTGGQKGPEDGGPDTSVPVRRSTRPRKEPIKYKSPCPSPPHVSKRSTTPESPEATLSSESESDSEELVEKTSKKKSVKKGKKGKKVVKREKKEEEKSVKKKKSGKEMTEYEKMIQKNIEERNAYFANMLKGEGDSFEEDKPVKSSARKKKNDSSSNDVDETKVQKPKKTRKVAKRRRKESSDEDEEPEMTYNTRSRGTSGRPRGIYKERDSDEESGAENDTLSDAADVSDGADDDEARARKKTRSYKRTRTSATAARELTMLVQKREEHKAKESASNPENIEEGSVSVEENGEEDEGDDKMDEDYVDNDSSSGDENAQDEETHEDESVDGAEIETSHNNDKIIISPKCNVKMNPKRKNTEEESDQDAEGSDDNDKPNLNTPSLKRKRDIDDSEDCISPKKVRRLRSEEFIEENKENSIPEESQDNASDILTPK